jgi:hypothetical protein
MLFLFLGSGALFIGIRKVRLRASTAYRRWFPIVWGSGAVLLGGFAAAVTMWGHFAALAPSNNAAAAELLKITSSVETTTSARLNKH